MGTLTERLSKIDLKLPTPAVPVAAYVPFVLARGLLFISGQLPLENGVLRHTGLVGRDLDLQRAQEAARFCALNILAQVNTAVSGEVARIHSVVKLGGFVASAEGFFDQPKVINGASELMEQVFGEMGRHARFAVGVSALPLNAAVEVDAVFALTN